MKSGIKFPRKKKLERRDEKTNMLSELLENQKSIFNKKKNNYYEKLFKLYQSAASLHSK